jgi:hypothetical protein
VIHVTAHLIFITPPIVFRCVPPPPPPLLLLPPQAPLQRLLHSLAPPACSARLS